MHTVTSIHSSAASPDHIDDLMTEYVAFEGARIYRRLFVTRFTLLGFVFGVAGLGVHWLSPFASWLGVGLCAVPPTWAWIVELKCGRRLDRRLQKVIKSS